MAMSNAKFDAPVGVPAAADVATVLRALDAQFRPVEMLRLLSVSLPVRECVWWACLAGRDLVQEGARAPKTLTCAEAWTFDPSDETRAAAREALDHADPDDPTMLCAMAASMSDGKLGPGPLAEHDAPPGATQTAAFGMNMLALGQREEEFFHVIQVLIARGLDIAGGGNGSIDPASVETKMPPIEPEEDDDDFDDEDDEEDDDTDDDEEDLA